jgi:N-acetylneuraminic acid mutarotase
MQSMNLFHKILILLFGVAISAQAVPPVLNFAGQVAVNGEAFDGNGLFKFALVNADGTTTYWSNDGTSVDGSEPQASVAVSVNGGLYSILLGNSAQQGMGAIDPAVFAQNSDPKLRVWFSDGVNGFQQLSPDRPFASVPYAFSAGTAQTAGSAPIANGAVNLDMLSQDVKTQINAPISRSRLSQEVVADINATIGMNRLSTEVTEKLNQEKTTNNYNAPSVGSLLAVPYGSDAPAGYSLFQQGEPKDLVWEEKAPVSVARFVGNGAVISNNEIYVIGGWTDNQKITQLERYNTHINTWESLSPLPVVRENFACAALDGKLYAMGGAFLSSVDVYDPVNNSWFSGIPLPRAINAGSALASDGKIYLFSNTSESMLCFDPLLNQWTAKANMLIPSVAQQAIFFQDRIWVIGGNRNGAVLSVVQSYDIHTDSWRIETSLNESRQWLSAWIANGKIYAGGGHNGSSYLKSVEVYDPTSKQWTNAGNFPEIKYAADSVILNENVYVIGGYNGSAFSNKVFAADLNASVEGVYDLYRKDGDAPVGTPVVQSEYADGSVTGSKMADGAITTDKLNEQILKYLKPEITDQPQAQTVYADTNASISVTAEGKYLTYQWKKDGVELTGETNATITITDANATLHDGNYSVVVSNDFGSVESEKVEVKVSDALLNGLVGWWKFDEGSGTVAYDSSGNGHDGNLTNGPTWAAGKIGGALSFDGVNDHVDLGELDFFKHREVLSISCWIKFDSLNNSYNEIITHEDVNALAITSSRKVHFNSGGGAGNWDVGINSSTALEGNQWMFICASRDFSTVIIFLDGNLDATTNYFTKSGSNLKRTYIGAKVGGNYLHGTLDDVRIYDRALSAEEVQALYNLGQ